MQRTHEKLQKITLTSVTGSVVPFQTTIALDGLLPCRDDFVTCDTLVRHS